MKLKFKHQSFQSDAVAAVTDLFVGQEKNQTTFSLDEQVNTMFRELGVGNSMLISDEQLLANMHETQKKNSLPLTDSLQGRQFSIEMETGTGKTYVYTKTIYELNRRYGFTKFIIVVPSVAIREGVYKSFEITKEHFGAEYDNVPCRNFIYNSAKLSDVRQFAVSSNIEIMIINIDAFRKAENIINQEQDKLNGETAMRYIQDTNPIVIIDEPQSVDNTPKAKEAIASLNPLCVFRYSATHKEKINLLYRLAPVDAYQMGLVKQIVVSSNRIEHDFNKPYIRLLSVSNDNGFRAKVEIDVSKDGKVSRKPLTIKPGDDLYVLSGERDFYEGYEITGINCTPGGEGIEFANTEWVSLGKAIGSVDENIMKRAQIRRTIEAHLDKELRYFEYGIKVLSLFFIDEVKKYRTEDGGKGIYAQMFEECYAELIAREKYTPLRDRISADVGKAHNGYFSQDKKGRYKNTKGDSLDDTSTYNTIMKDKEWLLSFECPLRFIWSHSALREGWDNPNVFQVCTLIEQKSTFTCRQKVGRGLRLCVNQDGERVEDKNINILHVMANESFAEFAETLQKEIEQETGVKFGVLQIGLFDGMTYTETKTVERTVTPEQAAKVVDVLKTNGVIDSNGSVSSTFSDEEVEQLLEEQTPEISQPAKSVIASVITHAFDSASDESDNITNVVKIDADAITKAAYIETVTEEKTMSYDEAADLLKSLEQKKLITKDGKMKDTMKNHLAAGTLDLGKRFSDAAQRAILQQIKKADTKPPVRNAATEVTVHLKKQVVLESPEFKALWDKIRKKTTYRVEIDGEQLVQSAAKALADMPKIPEARMVSQTADIDIQSPGVTYTEREYRTADIKEQFASLPNIVTLLSEATLTKKSDIKHILEQSGRINDFIGNPQLFIETAIPLIQENRWQLDIDGISYIRLAGEKYYVQEIFNADEFQANLNVNAVAVKNSVYDYVVYDSATVEKPFAVALDNDPDVKMFFKLPDRFKIDTPIGTYNPDWAVYLDKNGEEKLYFVLETKGSASMMDLRTKEQLKIHCGKEHFRALEEDVELRVATDWKTERAGM